MIEVPEEDYGSEYTDESSDIDSLLNHGGGTNNKENASNKPLEIQGGLFCYMITKLLIDSILISLYAV